MLIGRYLLYFFLEQLDFSGTYYRQDNDIEMVWAPSPPHFNYPPNPPDFYGPPASPDFNDPLDLPDPFGASAPTSSSHHGGQPEQLFSGRFVKTYEGCSEAFPGGETFMGRFRRDQFAEKCRENMYFPWASRKEWCFASWLLHSHLSMAAIDSLMSLEIVSWWYSDHLTSFIIPQMKDIPLSFRSAKELRTCAETLPSGPRWLCKVLLTEYPTKQPARLFYHDPIECLQALLSHPLLESHISFVPRRVWTSAAKLCHIYNEWLSGDHTWNMQVSFVFSLASLPMITPATMQEVLPQGATLLGVVLSSDKTNISVMSGNCMAHPLLISLANIAPCVHSRTSLHAYLLLALLPIANFTHKHTRVRSLLQDQLMHQAINIVLSPLQTAAAVGVMMSDPRGNLCYCFTPLATWIADMPEESLIVGTASKASPVTTTTSKSFGDAYQHPPCTAEHTLIAIRTACTQYSPSDYKNFLRAAKRLHLNGVTNPCWKTWPLSDPSQFLNPEVLHHFHHMFWDHDVNWCILALGGAELDFQFSLIQTPMGYRAFNDGVLKLKQVTGHDHRSVQRYIIGIVAGGAPQEFLKAIRTLLDFRYLAQAPLFTDLSIERVANALQEFHNHKEAIVRQGAQSNWQIPKLKLLQSVVPSIHQSGAVMQWSADITEHAHVDEIKVLAHLGNNQNYYSQIAEHLDQLDKCFCFNLATYIGERVDQPVNDDNFSDPGEDDKHEPDTEKDHFSGLSNMVRQIPNYFSISSSLLLGVKPSAPRPFHTFATSTTSFHLATKPLLQLGIDKAATLYMLPDLHSAVTTFFASDEMCLQVPQPRIDRLQIWHKVHMQQMSYHDNKIPLSLQMLLAVPPLAAHSYGQYDSVIISPNLQSNWPRNGLAGHSVAQLRMIFCLPRSDFFLAYVQHFSTVPQSNLTNISPVTGVHLLKRMVRGNGHVGEVIPLIHKVSSW